MLSTSKAAVGLGLALLAEVIGVAQVSSDSGVPVATQWTLDAAGATQRASIKSVFLMFCPVTQKKGTGFLIESGVIITNEHVVSGCNAGNIEAHAPTGETIHFTAMNVDTDRDLAVLQSQQEACRGPSSRGQRGTEPRKGGNDLGLSPDLQRAGADFKRGVRGRLQCSAGKNQIRGEDSQP